MAQGYNNGFPVDADPTLAADSDFLVPTQKAAKAYVDALDGRYKYFNAGSPGVDIQALSGTGSWIIAGAYSGTPPSAPFLGTGTFEIRQTESAPGTPYQQFCFEGTNIWSRLYSGTWGAWVYHLPAYEPTFLTYTGGSVATGSTSPVNVHSSANFTVPSAGVYRISVVISYDSAAVTTGALFRYAAGGGMATDFVNVLVAYDTANADRSTRSMATNASVISTLALSGNTAQILGEIRATAGGTYVLQFASEVNLSNITITNVTGFMQRTY